MKLLYAVKVGKVNFRACVEDREWVPKGVYSLDVCRKKGF